MFVELCTSCLLHPARRSAPRLDPLSKISRSSRPRSSTGRQAGLVCSRGSVARLFGPLRLLRFQSRRTIQFCTVHILFSISRPAGHVSMWALQSVQNFLPRLQNVAYIDLRDPLDTSSNSEGLSDFAVNRSKSITKSLMSGAR